MTPPNRAKRQYNCTVLVVMACFVVVILLHDKIAPVPRSATENVFAVLAIAPLVAVFAALGRYLKAERDEYIRARTVRQVLWATGGMLTFATAWGFLEEAGLPHLPMYFATIAWFACLGLVGMASRAFDH